MKNYIQKVAYNTGTQIIGKLVVIIISLVITAFITRYTGPKLYGYYVLIATYLALAGSFYDIGVGTIGSREIARFPKKSSSIMSNVFSLRFLFAIITFAGVVIISLLTYSGDTFIILRQAIIISAFTILINNLTSSWITIFLARLKMGHIAFSEVLNRAFVLFGVFLVIKYDLGFLAIVWATVLGNLLQLAVVNIFAKYLFHLKLFFTQKDWKKFFIDSWPLGLFLILANLLFRIDTIFISYLRDAKEVGLYGVSYKVFDIILASGTFFAGSVFPIIASRLQQRDTEGLSRAVRRSLEFMLFISLPLVIFTFFLAREIILFIAGKEFITATFSLKVLSVAVVFSFFGLLFGYLMVAKNKQKIALVIISVGLTINVILNLIFIPKFGFNAAAITTLLAQFIYFITTGYFILKFYPIRISTKNILQMFSLAIVLILFYSAFYHLNYSWEKFIIAFLGIFTYWGVLIFWNREFKFIFLRILNKNKNEENK